MRWWRHSGLLYAFAVFLLFWTATDLINPSLCALDNQAGVPISSTSTLKDHSTSPGPNQAPGHIDDCFCCSHCVDVQPPALVMRALQAVFRYPVTGLGVVRIFGVPLYHPPLA